MKLVVASLFLATSAQAAVIGFVDAGQGARMEFHDGPGDLCKAPARMVVYTDSSGETTVGCWVLRPEGVRVNWLDGDRDDVPHRAIRKPVDG